MPPFEDYLIALTDDLMFSEDKELYINASL